MAGGWESLGLLPELVKAAEEDYNWMLPTAVQDDAIPLILGGSDVMVASETGSGKTVAYAMPILQLCIEYMETRKQVGGSQDLQYRISSVDRDKALAVATQGFFIKAEDRRRWAGCRATGGVKKFPGAPGKYYFECAIIGKGIARVGLSTSEANLDLGLDEFGYGFGGTGTRVHNSQFEDYGDDGFTKDDVVGCLIDFTDGDCGSISFSKNGANLGKAFDLQDDLTLFPAVSLKNTQCSLNFGVNGLSDFRHPPADRTVVPLASATKKTGGVENPNDVSAANATADGKNGPLALVIVPTRDLARQTFHVFSEISNLLPRPVNASLLIGGVRLQSVTSELQAGKVDVLVGTPSIVSWFVNSGKLQTSRCRMLVLDEADSLVANKENFRHVQCIFGSLPTGTQTCLFSATLHHPAVTNLAATICHKPLLVDLVGNERAVPDTIVHCLVRVDVNEDHVRNIINQAPRFRTDAVHRDGALEKEVDWECLDVDDANSERLKLLKPQILLQLLDKMNMDQILVFVRTNLDANLLEKFLNAVAKQSSGMVARTYSCKVLAGKLSMEDRQKNLKAFNDGDVRVLIATDVAARGIDVAELPCVINYTLPERDDTYIHRVGRVGRNGRRGIAISIVAGDGIKEKVWYCQPGNFPPCSDCSLYADGGNCIWYDEPTLLKAIRNRLQGTTFLEIRLPDLELPDEVKSILTGQSLRAIEESSVARLVTHSKQVRELAALETKLQWDFFALKQLFSATTRDV